MATKSFYLPLLVCSFLSCQSNTTAIDPRLEAVFVVKETLGCRLPVVSFTKGLSQVRQIAGTTDTYDGYFSVYNLDSSYWQAGRKLTLTVRKPSTLTVCDALSLWHPAVEVVSVE